jgi:rRNA-processing protein FCF1
LAGAPSSPSSARASTKVLLDTNFLLLPFQRRVDIFRQIERLIGSRVEFVVLSQILDELHQLSETGPLKDRRAATSALELVAKYCRIADAASTRTTGLNADAALLRCAQDAKTVVATNDQELRRALVKQGSRAIFLRKLAFLAITE